MAEILSAQQMVPLVGRKVEDRGGRRFDATATLRAIDQAVEALNLKQQEAGQDHGLDYLDVNVAAARADFQVTAVGQEIQDISEWLVPENIWRIRRIEDTTTGNRPVEIPHGILRQKEFNRDSRFRRASNYWQYQRHGAVGEVIGFVGGLRGITSFRCWFIRTIPPLHYGIAKSGLNAAGPPVEVASDSTSIWFSLGSQGAGPIIEKGDVYRGAKIKFGLGTAVPYTGTIHGVTDEIRTFTLGFRRTDVATPLTASVWTWLFHRQLTVPGTSAGIPCAGFYYSLVPQIDPQHYELVIVDAAHRLAQDSGSLRTIAALKTTRDELLAQFLDATQRRQTQTPEFIDLIGEIT